MREKELRQHATCGSCGKKIGEAQSLRFWRVTIESFVLDVSAMQRQQGLAMAMGGNGFLAYHMGKDEEMAHAVHEPVRVSVCERCALLQGQPIAIIAEGWTPVEEAP